ncbi:MAG: competence/damage-inducible protein A [Ignavibacteriales bacterium]|nr:competence/damage-inducible protein A [Ignavibacteriales bacterium]
MKIQIISIGDEILIGDTINTNALFIASKLVENQFEVPKITVVGDDEDEILNEFNDALSKNDAVIVTGGLGPTHDDITKKCISKFFNSDLIINEEALNDLKIFFEKRGRQLTEINRMQALVPEVASVLKNTKGTAPGLWVEKDKKILISLPGVPYEMEALMELSVIPKLLIARGKLNKIKKVKNLLTTGMPESYLFNRLGNLDELLQGAKLAFLPNQFGVKVRITVEDDTEDSAINRLSEIEQKIRTLVGRYIYGIENISLEEVIGRLLKERGLTIAIAESCTGGIISNRLTNISGSSDYFERGLVTYSNAAKVELLKVNEDSIVEFGSVSVEVAKQMAEGIKAISGTDIGLSTTGIMGPTGATSTKPVGLVYIGFCQEKVCFAKKFQFSEDRILNKERSSQAALELLRRQLLGIPYEE